MAHYLLASRWRIYNLLHTLLCAVLVPACAPLPPAHPEEDVRGGGNQPLCECEGSLRRKEPNRIANGRFGHVSAPLRSVYDSYETTNQHTARTRPCGVGAAQTAPLSHPRTVVYPVFRDPGRGRGCG